MAERVSNKSLITWFLQRISGLFLGFFLITHLNVHHLFHDISSHGIIDFESVHANLSSSAWWKVYYFLFVPLIVFHGLNGLWQIIADLRLSPGAATIIKILLWLLGIILVVTATLTLNNLF